MAGPTAGSGIDQQVAKLSIVVDSTQTDTAVVSLDKLIAVGKNVEEQTKKITNETRKAAQPIKAVGDVARVTADGLEDVAKATQDAANKLDKISTKKPKIQKIVVDQEVSQSVKQPKQLKTPKISGDFSQYVESLKSVNKETKKFENNFDKTVGIFALFDNAAKNSTGSFDEYIEKIKKATQELENYSSTARQIRPIRTGSVSPAANPSVSQTVSETVNKKTSNVKTERIDNNFDSVGNSAKNAGENLKGASDNARKFGDETGNAGKKANEHLKDVEKTSFDVKGAMRELGSVLLPAATVAGAAAAINQMRVEAQEFEKQLALVSTILEDQSQLEYIKTQSKEIANIYGSLPVDNVKAFNNVLSKGFEDAADAQSILIAGTKLSTGSGADFNIAISGLTTALKSYGIEAKNVGDVTDAFFIAQKAGATNIEDLSANIGEIASISKNAGLSFDELIAGISAISNTGISTSMSVTNMRQAILSIVTPSDKAKKAAKEMGIDFSEAGLKTKGFVNMMEEIKEKTGGSSQKLNDLFNSVEAFNAAQALTGSVFDDFKKALVDMETKTGATEEAYKKMADTFDHQTNLIASKAANLRQEIGEKLLEKTLPAITALNENFDQIVNTFELAAKAALAIGFAMYGIPLAAKSASLAMTTAKISIDAFSTSSDLAINKVGKLQASLSLLAAAFIGWEAGKYLKENFEWAEKAGIAMSSGIHTSLVRLASEFKIVGEEIKFSLGNPADFIRGRYADMFENLSFGVRKFLEAIGQQDLSAELTQTFDKMRGDGVKKNQELLDKIKADTQKEIQGIKDEYMILWDEVGNKNKKPTANKSANDGSSTQVKTTVNDSGNKTDQSEETKKAAEEALKREQKARDDLNNSYQTTLNRMKEQIQLTGETTNVAKMRFDLENSELSKLNQNQKQTLLNYAEAADKIDEINKKLAEQEKINTKAKEIQDRINKDKAKEDKEFAKQQLQEKYDEERKIILDNEKIIGEERTQLLTDLEEERQEALGELNVGYWEQYLEAAEENLMNFQEMSATVLDEFTSGFGDALEQMVFDSTNFEDAMKNLAESMLRTIVNAIGKMAAQWLAYQAIQLITGKTTQQAAATQITANAYAMALQGGINAFASTAAIPIVGPAAAPGAMSAAEAILQPMATAVSSLAFSGMAHDGIMSVPEDGTWLLQKGERVTTANTSKKLDATLDNVMNSNQGNKQVNQYFNITTQDANSFRQSERQILKNARRAIS